MHYDSQQPKVDGKIVVTESRREENSDGVPAAHSAGCADRAARHDADARRGHALAGARRADRRWRRCCTIRHGRLPPGNGDATELLPRRAWHAYAYGAGTLDGAAACIGRAGCLEPLAPGSSFCWGPELQGSTSPSSSRSSTRRRAGRDRREVRRARAPAPPVQAPATPPAPRTDPAPSRRFAPPTRRLARLASTSPPLARVCAGAQCCPSTSTRVEGGAPRRRSVCGAARAGRGGAWAPRGDEGGGRWGAPRPPPRRPAMGQKGPPHTDSFFFQAT